MYCSAATREILLRLEKYHYRINFAKGLLESRNVTYDKSMRKLAKPLPLDTPTEIELAPGQTIRVTLLDANHCIGAVMFLIEGDGKAVLYTGDIRAETWWVNSLVQNPVLLPYTMGLRRLDCLYLDNTFAETSEPHHTFPSKAEGIRELLEKVSQYDEDTVFYFHSWTFGYENVWIALSNFLKSQIHLDDYRTRIYGSLSMLGKGQLWENGLKVATENKFLRESRLDIREAPALCGFRNGNHTQPGCLTSRESVRIHSCEQRMGCRVMDNDKDAKIVHIIPIVNRCNGVEYVEKGAGGGKGDLNQTEDSVTGDVSDLFKLIDICAQSIKEAELREKVITLVQRALNEDHGNIDIGIQTRDENDLSLQAFVSILSSLASKTQSPVQPQNRTIRFPYSRHSSYSELCGLLEAFKPKDVFPCTVDENSWSPAMSVRNLFGKFCSNEIFRHDTEMMLLYEARLAMEENNKRSREDTQEDTQQDTQESDDFRMARKRVCSEQPSEPEPLPDSSPMPLSIAQNVTEKSPELNSIQDPGQVSPISAAAPELPEDCSTTRPPSFETAIEMPVDSLQTPVPSRTSSSTPVSTRMQMSSSRGRQSRSKHTNQQLAYHAALGTHLTWSDYGGLESTRSKVDRNEVEL